MVGVRESVPGAPDRRDAIEPEYGNFHQVCASNVGTPVLIPKGLECESVPWGPAPDQDGEMRGMQLAPIYFMPKRIPSGVGPPGDRLPGVSGEIKKHVEY